MAYVEFSAKALIKLIGLPEDTEFTWAEFLLFDDEEDEYPWARPGGNLQVDHITMRLYFKDPDANEDNQSPA
jgi:hypothetical protein